MFENSLYKMCMHVVQHIGTVMFLRRHHADPYRDVNKPAGLNSIILYYLANPSHVVRVLDFTEKYTNKPKYFLFPIWSLN